MEFELALYESMQEPVISRLILAEQRKIVRHAIKIGALDGRALNEGVFADVVLGLGQAVGSLPGLAQTGAGAAFGAAGVLWYGKEMLKHKVGSFDFFMNLVFALFSAAAIEPTGVFGEAGALGKLIIPFVKLGSKAKALGGASKAAAVAFVQALGPAEAAILKSALKAEGPIMAGINFVNSKLIPKIPEILSSVAGTISKLPGGKEFVKISELISKHAGPAWTVISDSLKGLISVGKQAAGQAAAKYTQPLLAKMSQMAPAQLEKMFVNRGIEYTTKSGKSMLVTIEKVAENGSLIVRGPGNKKFFIAAERIPNAAADVAKQLGQDAAAALVARVQAKLPTMAARSAMKVVSGQTGT
jgi:hypothetical protein